MSLRPVFRAMYRVAGVMVTDLSQADHDLLSAYLNTILDGYRDGLLSQMEARVTLAEAFSLAAKDNV